MIRDIHIPTQATPENPYSQIPLEEKLEAIASASVVVRAQATEHGVPIIENRYLAYFADSFSQAVPYVNSVSFELNKDANSNETVLYVDQLKIGDDQLYGHGIGTRLLHGTIEFALEKHPNLSQLRLGIADMAMVNTVAKVVGQDNLSVRHNRTWYGPDHSKPLDDIFSDRPYRAGERYRMHEVRATIDPQKIKQLGNVAISK